MVRIFEDYDIRILYHLCKANMVLDALSRLNMGGVSHVEARKKDQVKDVLRLVFDWKILNDVFAVHHNFESSLVVEVMSKQYLDPSLTEFKESVLCKFNKVLSLGMVF